MMHILNIFRRRRPDPAPPPDPIPPRDPVSRLSQIELLALLFGRP